MNNLDLFSFIPCVISTGLQKGFLYMSSMELPLHLQSKDPNGHAEILSIPFSGREWQGSSHYFPLAARVPQQIRAEDWRGGDRNLSPELTWSELKQLILSRR
jgi:hypothetical protein